MKVGLYLKILEDIIDPKSNILILSEYDIVKVIKMLNKKIQVQDILGITYWIPKSIKYKIVSNKNFFQKASIEKEIVKIKGGIVRNSPTLDKTVVLRSVVASQALVSNLLSTEDPVLLGKLSTASSLLAMSIIRDMPLNQSTRLLQLAKRIISSC